ncbi:MAG: hypothetical protein ABJX94_15065 [Flavobacteriaceae bacterium]
MTHKLPKSNRYWIFWIFVFVVLPEGMAQEQSAELEPAPKVHIRARVGKQKILLRWAVDTPYQWHLANTLGFVLEKYLISKDGVRLPQP